MLESLLTAQIIDEMTDTDSDKNKESRGQGIANIVTGFFGGMAGGAMIAQSVINTKAGGRLSAFIAGAFLMFLIAVLSHVVVKIPMAALVAVMVMVSVGTFDWSSLKGLKKAPITDSIVMVVTDDLSKGVFVGALLSAVFFVAKISKLKIVSHAENQKLRTYQVKGQIFFASVLILRMRLFIKRILSES
ncbi:permease [Bacillus tequilensis]|nr:permease [Bacillus tequilensis]